MPQPEDYLSAYPIPLVIQPHERVMWLQERLQEPENERQRVNILALIRMYESGELGPLTTGRTTWLCDGKICDNPLTIQRLPPRESVLWCEGIAMQMIQKSNLQAASSTGWYRFVSQLSVI